MDGWALSLGMVGKIGESIVVCQLMRIGRVMLVDSYERYRLLLVIQRQDITFVWLPTAMLSTTETPEIVVFRSDPQSNADADPRVL